MGTQAKDRIYSTACFCPKHLLPQAARIEESGKTVPTRKGPSLSIPLSLEHAQGPWNVGGRAAAHCSISVWGGAGNGAQSKVLGRCWELRPSRPEGPCWRRKGSRGKVYQRTSLTLGATRQMHTSEQRGEKETAHLVGGAWREALTSSWEPVPGGKISSHV